MKRKLIKSEMCMEMFCIKKAIAVFKSGQSLCGMCYIMNMRENKV